MRHWGVAVEKLRKRLVWWVDLSCVVVTLFVVQIKRGERENCFEEWPSVIELVWNLVVVVVDWEEGSCYGIVLSLLRLKDKIRSSVLEDRSPKSRENYYSSFFTNRGKSADRSIVVWTPDSLISGGLSGSGKEGLPYPRWLGGIMRVVP